MKKLFRKIIYVWEGHVTNWPWRSRLSRRNRRNEAFTRMKMEYLKKYIPFIENLGISEDIEPKDDKDSEPVFSLWLQGIDTAPLVVKRCVESLRRSFGKRFVMLESDSIKDYVEIPDFIREKWESGKMLPAHFSDIVRIELLCRYGGYWFDATDYITGPVPDVISSADFFMYLASDKLLKHTFVQNYFIRSRKGDPLLRMWRELVFEYWKNEEKAESYYLVQHLFRLLLTYNIRAARLFAQMPKIELDCTQVIWHETGNDPYDSRKFESMCENAFFQKCTYKKKTGIIREILPGSMADFLINGIDLNGREQ